MGQADSDVNVAGIVVDYGDGRMSYALVPYAGDTLSGMQLLDRSGLSLLTVEFGAMGEGVCAIAQTGCDISACRRRLCQSGDPDSPFWHYLRQTEPGTWQLAPLGASSSVIEDGDVDGWFWTGNTPNSDAISLDEIAGYVGVELAEFRSTAKSEDEAIVVTIGKTERDESPGNRREAMTGAAIVIGLIAIGGYAVWRSRQQSAQ